MNKKRFVLAAICALAGASTVAGRVQANTVTIAFNNPGNASFSLTPLWYGFHAAEFDIFDGGQPASPSLEALAEDGIVGGLQSDFAAADPAGQQGVLTAPGGFSGAPVIEPGETASFTFDRALSNRFLSFASMVIPSNDAFIGSPQAIEIFNPDGSLVGGGNTRTITIAYDQIWDAGTEVNDTLGAAFSTMGGVSSDENGLVQLMPAGGLNNFLNTTTAAGASISTLFAPGATVATLTVTVIPEPATATIAAMALWLPGLMRRRK